MPYDGDGSAGEWQLVVVLWSLMTRSVLTSMVAVVFLVVDDDDDGEAVSRAGAFS